MNEMDPELLEAHGLVFIRMCLNPANHRDEALRKKLDERWETLTRGLHSCGVDEFEEYLGESELMVTDISSDIAGRLNLVLFTRKFFAANPSFKRLKSAFSDYIALFIFPNELNDVGKPHKELPEKDEDEDGKASREERNRNIDQKHQQDLLDKHRKTFLRLLAMAVVLDVRENKAQLESKHKVDKAEKIDIKLLLDSNKYPELKEIPEHTDLSEATRDAAKILRGDENLTGYYDETMRILAKEIDEKLNRFPRPPNQMYIDEILNGPNLLGDITKEQDKDQSMPTVPYQTHQDGHIWGQDPSSPYQSYNERSPEPIAEDQDEEMDSQRNNRKSIEMKSPEMKSPEMMSPEPRASSRYPQRNTTQRTTLRKPPHRDSAVGLPVTDKGKRVKKDDTPVEAEEDMDDLTPPRETKRKKAESDEEFKSSTDDEVGTPPLLRSPKSARTRIDDLSGAGSSRRGRQPATTSPSPSPSEGRAPKKARQPTRHWTEEEIERLNELVEDPRFIYHGDEQGSRKRDFKWSRIKAWDQKHGNILKNRTPVNLKDKYRDMNDKGAHRRLVMERLVKKKEGSPSPSTATATATTTTTTTATAGGSRFAKLRTRPM